MENVVHVFFHIVFWVLNQDKKVGKADIQRFLCNIFKRADVRLKIIYLGLCWSKSAQVVVFWTKK